jgi:hypothetical protein
MTLPKRLVEQAEGALGAVLVRSARRDAVPARTRARVLAAVGLPAAAVVVTGGVAAAGHASAATGAAATGTAATGAAATGAAATGAAATGAAATGAAAAGAAATGAAGSTVAAAGVAATGAAASGAAATGAVAALGVGAKWVVIAIATVAVGGSAAVGGKLLLHHPARESAPAPSAVQAGDGHSQRAPLAAGARRAGSERESPDLGASAEPEVAAAPTALSAVAPAAAHGAAGASADEGPLPGIAPAQAEASSESAAVPAEGSPVGVPPPAAAKREPRERAPLGRELTLLDEARQALRAGDTGAAMALLDRHSAEFPNGKLGDAVSVLRIEALWRAGERAKASRLAAEFMASHPNSPLRAGVRQYVVAEESTP